jgi:hypothetical protein
MKEQPKAILGLAVFYTVTVAILEFFLSKIPVINWLALTVAFIFFTAFILGAVMEFRPKQGRVQEAVRETYEDEIERLGKTIERGSQQNQPESLRTLEERLKSIALNAYAHHTNQTIDQISHDNPELLATVLADEQMSVMFKNNDGIPTLASPNDLKKVLSRIEDWLA